MYTMDDYLIMYEHNGDEEQAERSTETSVRKPDQQTKIKQNSTKIHGFQMEVQGGNAKSTLNSTIKGFILTLVILLVVVVLISLAAIVLSILSYNAADHRDGAKIKEENLLNSLQVKVPDCGAGEWHRVVYLNMSDPAQRCPSNWRERTYSGIRTCDRPQYWSCPGTIYPISHTYSKVCGRVIGYQYGSPDAFATALRRGSTINQPYLDGISITQGNPRTHIWSYAVGASENGSCTHINCPCSNGDQPPPSFVGNNYYCESAHQGDCWINDIFFATDPLWDGQQCDNEDTCCTGTNTPPWFSVDLPNSSSDDLEVRICHDQDTSDEGSFVQLLELYIQ